MSLNLPSELAFVLNLLGYNWPQLDEDEIHRGAQMVRQFGEDIEASMDEISRIVEDQVGSALTARAQGAYAGGWSEAKEQNLGELCGLLDTASTGIDLAGHAVLGLKLKVIAELVITAAQIATALAAAVLTLGASAAVQGAIIVARKKVMDIVIGEIVAAALVEILSMVEEPLSEVLEAVVTRFLETPVVSSAVEDVVEYHADLQALDQATSDLDQVATDQERLCDDFVAQLSSLQISTAG